MANPFEALADPAPAAPTRPNPFSQFAEPASAAEPKYDDAGDVGGSIVSGLVNGVTGIVGMPGTIQRAEGALYGKALDAVGLPNAAESVRNLPFMPSQDTVNGLVEKITGPLYKPQTAPGQYAHTLAEFASGAAIGPGGPVRKLAETVIPAAASEYAGQATKGTAYEPYARLVAAITGGLGTAAAVSRANAPARVIGTAAGRVSPEQFGEAQRIAEAGQRIGNPLTGAEAIQQATGNATKLADVQRFVEGSPQSVALSEMMARRPGAMKSAADNAFDTIAPQSANPSTLGPRASDAAHGAIMATPEGTALQEAIWRTATPETAGSVGPRLQEGLRGTYERREGMRNALADQDYRAAREAEPQIDVSSLEPRTFQPDQRTTYRYGGDEGGYAPVEPAPGTPRIEALSAPDASGMIQADPRNIAGFIDGELQNAKGGTASVLGNVRSMLSSGGGLDTTVAGLGNVRSQVGALLTAAVRDGDRPTAAALTRVQNQIDSSLALVPEHAAATQNFAAASRPLEPFQTPALSKAIDYDERAHSFTMPAERVAPSLEAAGPSVVRIFNGVAPPEARAGFEDYLGTKLLNAATDGRGRLSGDRLALGTRDSADILGEVPGLRERIMGVQAADTALAGQRVGPVGQISEAATTDAAGRALLPPAGSPHLNVGGQGELADATRRIGALDPEAIAQLVRQRLANQADASMTRLVGGEAQGGGAKFAKDIAGTDQQEANLGAVVGALPNSPDAPRSLVDLIENFRATGTRKPQGSPTDFNTQYRAEIGGETLPQQGLTALKTGGRSLLANAGDAARRAYLGRNNASLAELFVAPDSVQRIREIAARRAEPKFGNSLARLFVQSPATMSAR
ncbi:hypothetical protein [Methylobacterium sp. WL9]|uniref:hypothetical protein n=1 Tax=Methylobacterium sp. WL9 TaxID=2603898 RepID=UPI0011CA20DC|nr:hypothetical protein [Methylobacterium sp. WL9]TXN21282.1 hypothetical protein FV217_14900 [Methylobacterium sp. WL9]